MKKLFGLLVLVVLLYFTITYKNKIVGFILREIIYKDQFVFEESNTYYRDYEFAFVSNTDNLFPKNKQDLLNILYTTLNRGSDNVSFFCSDAYTSCVEDINKIVDEKEELSVINNLVHPFNSYRNIHFDVSSFGKVDIRIEKTYSDSEINLINNKINNIKNSLFYNSISNTEKIKLFHDYIVNNTVYDNSIREENMPSNSNSNNALGLLFEGKAVCSGYSDTMAIFLNSEGFKNYKISSVDHIWNFVNIDNNWLHIDTTWDDPVTSDGSNVLIHDFFLINSKELNDKDIELNKTNHSFDRNFYYEASF